MYGGTPASYAAHEDELKRAWIANYTMAYAAKKFSEAGLNTQTPEGFRDILQELGANPEDAAAVVGEVEAAAIARQLAKGTSDATNGILPPTV